MGLERPGQAYQIYCLAEQGVIVTGSKQGQDYQCFKTLLLPIPLKPTLDDLGCSNMQKCHGVVDHSDQKFTEKVYPLSVYHIMNHISNYLGIFSIKRKMDIR